VNHSEIYDAHSWNRKVNSPLRESTLCLRKERTYQQELIFRIIVTTAAASTSNELKFVSAARADLLQLKSRKQLLV